MIKGKMKKKGASLCSALVIMMSVTVAVPAYADTADDESMISDITVPENGIIQYDVTVPAGSTVSYEVELTPDDESAPIDRVAGMWKNTTKKDVTKTITAKVKFLSNEYTISASYTSNSTHQKLEYKDKATAVKSYEESASHSRFEFSSDGIEELKKAFDSHIRKIAEYIK